MAVATVNWTNVPGATGYKVEYKKASVGTWTLFSANISSSPANITGLEIGTVYDFRVTTNCTTGMSTGVLQTQATPCEATTIVSLYESIPAIPPSSGTASNIIKVNSVEWNNGGARVYNTGFPLNGDGTLAAALLVPHLWVNGDSPFNPSRNLVDSRMNVAGVWVNPSVNNEWVGFARKISVTSQKVYYVGVCADNMIRVKFNGVEILNFENILGGPNFNYMHIYPITFNAGDNFIELEALNTSSVAGFAAEIYDMTLTQLQNATSSSDLNIIFSSLNLVGQPVDTGTVSGWSCPVGYALDTSTTPTFTCKRKII